MTTPRCVRCGTRCVVRGECVACSHVQAPQPEPLPLIAGSKKRLNWEAHPQNNRRTALEVEADVAAVTEQVEAAMRGTVCEWTAKELAADLQVGQGMVRGALHRLWHAGEVEKLGELHRHGPQRYRWAKGESR